jgi:3-hydroxyacyl-CoA dehydrogenase/enoyl-CoA hydratase/3-hydroxybutyryl-CoA epimerase
MDVVVEAVPEDLALKQRVFAELDELCPTGCVLASNTSALPIARIAERCVHKDRVIGLHFFSPVHEMPLLEIVRAPATSQRAVATAIALARRLGKTPIVVADAPGFYTTRVLGFYLMAALRLAEHGHAIADIDAGARDVGWPVGPFALLDEVGIDVGAKVLHTLASAFPARVEIPDAVDRFLAEERFGRKSGRGFYVYPKDKKKRIDPEVMRFFAGRPTKGRAATPESLGERLTFVFAMEAVRCLEEGVVSGPSDGDVGAVLGLGYPPLRGGPFRHVDSLGIANVVARLDELGEVHGPGYEVPDSLRELARTGRRFADVPASAEGA